jgi:multidrug efflux system membrane fusion protein
VVTSGLTAGDRGVVDGVQKIFFPGMPVKATAVPMAPAERAAPASAVAVAAK